MQQKAECRDVPRMTTKPHVGYPRARIEGSDADRGAAFA
jgi:hypothetical protein